MNQHTSEDLFRLLHVQLEREASARVRAKVAAALNGHKIHGPGRLRQVAALKAYWKKRREQKRGNP